MALKVTLSRDPDLARHFTGKVRLNLYVDGTPTLTKDVRGPANVWAFIERAVSSFFVPREELEVAVRAALKADPFGADIEKRL